MRALMLFSVFLILSLPVQAADSVRVFQLKYQRAEAVLADLEKLAGDSVRLAASGTRIVASGDPDALDRLAEMVRSLDRQKPQWLIRVRQEKSAVSDAFGASGTDGRNRIGYRLGNMTRAGEQTLLVLDGATGFISIGRDEPFVTSFAAMVGETTGLAESIDYRQVRTGFTVRPHAVGDAVELELVPTLERVAGEGRGKRILFSRSATTLRAVPGDWIDIGRVYDRAGGAGLALLSYRVGNMEKHYRLRVRVEPGP
ncbi:MAG: hypothetical protein D6751_01770 [Deltaproteobacteria bacterium]|nr:MAG: hypothetical protein D6751_01770 [Deltaproteobacteria bacterium]